MKTKKALIKYLNNVDLKGYDVDTIYSDIYNACNEYMNDTQDFRIEEYFNDFVSSDTVEDILKNEVEQGGLARVKCFLNDININEDLYRINGYGNLENVSMNDMDTLVRDLINELE